MSKRTKVFSKKDDSVGIRSKKETEDETTEEKSKGGLDEIDALFNAKKTSKKRHFEEENKKRKQLEDNEAKRRKLRDTSIKKKKLHYDRSDILEMREREWADDGLGGKFNNDGFTGRKHDGLKVFKAHLFNKPNFGSSASCPFDCDCCFI